MPKKDNLQLHDLTIQINENAFHTKSAKNIGRILLDTDFRKHPVWVKSDLNTATKSDQAQQYLTKFLDRFKK